MKSTVPSVTRPRPSAVQRGHSLRRVGTTQDLLALGALLFLVVPLSTGFSQWQSFDRPGESFRALALSDTVIFALTSPYAVHTSGDYGHSWSAHECRVPATLEAFCLGVLDGKPVGGTGKGRYVHGWGLTPNLRQAVAGVEDDIQAVISTRRGTLSVWYLGGFGGGVRRSTNAGGTWVLCNDGLTDLNVTSLVTVPAPDDSSQILFAGSYGGGVFRSVDDGMHWEASNSGLEELHVYGLIAHGDTLYAAHSGGRVSRSSNAGMLWNTVGTGLPSTDVISLAQSTSGDSRYVYAGTIDRGIWRYSQADGSWEPVNSGLKSMRINAIVAKDDVLILGTDRGLYRSLDRGSSWQPADNGAIPLVNAVCAASFTSGVPATRFFTVSEAHYSYVEAYGGVPLFSSRVSWTDDRGQTWTTVPFYPNYITTLYPFTNFATQQNDCILLFSAGTWESDALRCVLSTDRGATWGEQHRAAYIRYCSLSGVIIRDVPAEQRFEIYITTTGGPWPGLARSLDSGRSWSQFAIPNLERTRAPLVSQGSWLYTATASSALRTSDGGLTWDTISYNRTSPGCVPTAAGSLTPVLTLLYANDEYLFARVAPQAIPGDPGGLCASGDHGDTWIPAGFPGRSVDRIAEADSILFAVEGGHIYASRGSSFLWKDISGTLAADSFVVITASPECVFALTQASDRIWYRPMAEIRALLNENPVHVPLSTPVNFALLQNYPNPFNPTTTIRYQVAVPSHVKLAVFDLLGRKLAVLVDERKEPGRYEARFNASGLSSGMYFYRMRSGDFVETHTLMLLK